MASRPEISCPSAVNRGCVNPITQASRKSSPTRMNIARNRPSLRATSRRCCGSLSTRIEMKMMLSIPSTSSSAMRVTNAIQACGSASSSIIASRGSHGSIHAVAGSSIELRRDEGSRYGEAWHARATGGHYLPDGPGLSNVVAAPAALHSVVKLPDVGRERIFGLGDAAAQFALDLIEPCTQAGLGGGRLLGKVAHFRFQE